MLKRLCLLLLFLPALARAECGFVRDATGTLSIIVGKNASTCFGDGNFREAFIADLTEAVGDGPPAARSKGRSIDDRSASENRLWALEERVYQGNPSRGTYYGQKP